jgi:hypothetical protein
MSESLLLRTLRYLTPAERRAVADWTRVPAVNRRPEITRLADYLTDCLEKPARRALAAEDLFAAAFPDLPFDNQRLRLTQSYLLAIVRRFLAQTEWQAESAAEERYFLRALRRRGMDEFFEREWKDAGIELEKAPARDARYHLHRYEWLCEHGEYTTKRQRAAGIDLQPLPDELTAFYLAEMLAHACRALNHHAVSGQAYRFEVLDAVLAAAAADSPAPNSIRRHLESSAISMYLHVYRALQPGSMTDDFFRLKEALAANAPRFGAEEMRGLYLQAINACIRRMNTGQRAYIREAFELYRAALENDFLLENGVLSGFTYRNILRLAAALDEHDWAEQFLEAYRPALHARERDHLYRYNRAFLYFQQHDYARAMPLLRQVDFDDPLHNLDARRLLLRSYYELGEWDALDSLMQSFAAYLRRQKNLGYHRATNEKLLYFTRKLLEINKEDRAGRQKLKAELEGVTDVAERAWLLTVL